MKILQIFPRLNRGGLEIGALQVAKAWVQSGHQSYIMAEKGPLLDQVQSAGITIIHHHFASKSPLQILMNALHIARFVRSEGIDLIHIRSRAPAWSAYLASIFTKTPLVSTVHGQYSAKSWLKKFYNSVMIRPTQIIVISEYAKQAILKTYQGFLRHEPMIHVIPRGIPKDFFEKPAQLSPREDLFQKHNFPHDTKILLVCGRVSQQKGHHVLLQALALLNHKRIAVVAVGDTNEHAAYFHQLQSDILAQGLKERFVFLGPQDNMIPLYDCADLVIFPVTRPEPFGRIIVEAQARKKIVIAAQSGAAPELMPSSLRAFLHKPNDPQDLAQKIMKALTLSAPNEAQLTEEAFDFVQQYFREETMTNATLKVYKAILQH